MRSGRTGGSGSGRPEFARGLSLAFEFAGAVFLFWLLGWLVDSWLGTEPVAQIIGSLLGWVGGFLHVYYATKSPVSRPGAPSRVARRSKTATKEETAKKDDTSPTTGSEGTETGK